MAVFGGKLPLYGYEVNREGEDNVMRINYEGAPLVPSIEDSPIVMSRTCDHLIESQNVTKIIFTQKREYEYDYNQTSLLRGIALLYDKLSKQKDMFTVQALQVDEASKQFVNKWYTEIQKIVFQTLRSDPLGAYVEIKRMLREERINYIKIVDDKLKPGIENYIKMLTYIVEMFEKTKLIIIAKPFIAGYKIGDRDVYRNFFHPTIKPDFMWTKLMATYPPDGEEIDSYTVSEDTEITIFRLPNSVQYIYHMTPPEFKLSEDEYELLDMARNILAEHKPSRQEFTDPTRMREIFTNVGTDLLAELVNYRNLKIDQDGIERLARILVRYTIGFGLVEVLLQDDAIQDISVNSPQGRLPIFIVHGNYSDCVTNIIPTTVEAESWATKLRMISGRPLDEANVILDTELELPGASIRVSTITQPLDPSGLAFSFRRHRDRPWTLPLFIKNQMITPFAAGLLSFLVDGTRSMMVCGTRSSGKSSFLSALLIEIMRRYRIITIEDSVSEDSRIVIDYRGKIYFTDIGSAFQELKQLNGSQTMNQREVIRLEDAYTPSISQIGCFEWRKATRLVRHKVNKPLYNVITRTGRKLKITGDHSIFCLAGQDKHILREEKISLLNKGDRIAVPRRITFARKPIKTFSCLDALKSCRISDGTLKKVFLKVNNPVLARYSSQIKEKGMRAGYAKVTINRWLRGGIVPYTVLSGLPFRSKDIIAFKYGANSRFIPTNIKLDLKMMSFLGLWIADGCFDKNSVILSVSSKEERDLFKYVTKRFNLVTRMHSDNFSLMVHSLSFKFLMGQLLSLKGNAYTKKIPAWIMTTEDSLKAAFLNGLFSGDGCISKNEIIISLASKNLLDDVQTLLLNWGIIFRINRMRQTKHKANDRTRDGRISSHESITLFKKHIGFIQSAKKKKLNMLSKRTSTHNSSDTVRLNPDVLAELSKICPRSIFNTQDYIKRKNAIGRDKLARIVNHLRSKGAAKLAVYLRKIADSDIFWDEIVSIRKLPSKPQYVYDVSVPGTESFIANNILAHNTLELPTGSMRHLGFNIQPMKVASALAKGSSEMSAEDGIRSTLRLGDSSLIVGEVRSGEAKALYEAMRIGAAANVVAGTIHADSPFGLFDRVVNDIGIPKTSFKATDIVIIATPIKSADGLHRFRRITQITEIRKSWQDDPMLENGFVDIMKYDPKTDTLNATDALLDGDSEVLKAIAANIPDFAGDWDSVYNNVVLRADIKEYLVKRSEEINDAEMLEAPFVIKCNDKFHLISEDVKNEKGVLDPNEIKVRWINWFERELKRRKLNKGQDDFNPYGLSY